MITSVQPGFGRVSLKIQDPPQDLEMLHTEMGLFQRKQMEFRVLQFTPWPKTRIGAGVRFFHIVTTLVVEAWWSVSVIFSLAAEKVEATPWLKILTPKSNLDKNIKHKIKVKTDYSQNYIFFSHVGSGH